MTGIIFLHGVGSTGAAMRPLAEALEHPHQHGFPSLVQAATRHIL